MNPKKFQHAISCMFPYSLVRYHLLGVWRVSGECLKDVWKVGRCLEGVWNVSGRCLEGVWRVSKGHQKGIGKVSGRRLEDIRGFMQILCKSHTVSCKSHANFMQISCKSQEDLRKISGKSQANHKKYLRNFRLISSKS